jgi:hypothetical protein
MKIFANSKAYIHRWLLPATLLSTVPVLAQAPTATLVGRVTDVSSAVIPGATVEVRNAGTNQLRTVKTTGQGEYTVTTLDPGTYQVTISRAGFQTSKQDRLQLEADQTARLDVKLQVGDVTTSVSVAADVGLLNTETSTKGDVITPVEISEIPLNGRDFNDLAFTVAGVQPAEQKAKGAEYVANGSRADSSGVYIDGINDENPRDAGSQISPPLDSIQEFRMETSDYTAEYGRLAGSVVNLAIKQGTNKYHGSVFDYIRNDFFDAPLYNFNPGAGASSEAKLRRNQFGADLAGPVWIPHIYNGHDRTFFNLDLGFYRQVQGENSLTTVPTILERSGDFSQSLAGGLPYYFHNPAKSASSANSCGASGGPGCLYGAPYDKIPTGSIDPVAKALLAYVPLPNIASAAAGSNNYQFISDTVKNWNRGLIKVNQQLTPKDQLTGVFDRDFSTSSDPAGGSPLGNFPANSTYGIVGANFGSATSVHATLMAIGETRIFTPNLVNDFHYGRTRTVSKELANDAGVNYAAQLGISGTATGPTGILGFPSFKPSGYTSIGDSASDPVTYTVNDYDGSDLVTWSHHRHNFRFGGDILHVQLFQPTNTDKNGAFTYNGKFTSTGTADALADLLTGYPATSLLMIGGTTNHLINTNYAGFAQDDYKASNRLTLNLGFRYELQTLPAEQNGQLTNFVPSLGKIVYSNASSLPNINATLAQSGLSSYYESAADAGLPTALVHTNKGRFSPRVGFAYRPFDNDKTVIRGGYGIFYTGIRLTVIRTNLAGQYPFSVNTTYTANAPSSSKAGSAFISSANPFPTSGGSLNGILTPNGYDPNAPSAYLQSYNFTIERDLGWGMGLEVAYAGSKGTHLAQETDYNQERIANTNTSRPLPAFSTITEMYFNGISHYDAGQVTLRRRFEHGLFFRVNYTFAKSLDSQSGANAAGGGGYFANQDVTHPQAEYGLSDFDIRHNFSGTMVYRTSSRFYALRDWQESGTVQAYSGQPFTPTVSGTQDLGVATRPNQVCNGNSGPHTINQWFNAACFVVPTSGFGNAGRNILEGPGFVNLNLSLGRVFSLERYGSFEFRLEGFNALNHPNFGYPTAVIGSSKPAGIISTINGNQRLVQISGRYSF